MQRLDSDVPNADSQLISRFYKRAVEDKDQTLAQGRPIFKEVDYVHIMIAGNQFTEIDRPVYESDKTRFAQQWYAYQNKVGTEEKFNGTPVDQWPLINKGQAEELRAIKFYTVESIANASDLQLQRLGMAAGMSPFAFRDKAKAFLNLASQSADVDKKEQELAQLREENAKIKAETDAKLAQMQEQMAAILAAVGEKKPKTRKPKVVEEA